MVQLDIQYCSPRAYFSAKLNYLPKQRERLSINREGKIILWTGPIYKRYRKPKEKSIMFNLDTQTAFVYKTQNEDKTIKKTQHRQLY